MLTESWTCWKARVEVKEAIPRRSCYLVVIVNSWLVMRVVYCYWLNSFLRMPGDEFVTV